MASQSDTDGAEQRAETTPDTRSSESTLNPFRLVVRSVQWSTRALNPFSSASSGDASRATSSSTDDTSDLSANEATHSPQQSTAADPVSVEDADTDTVQFRLGGLALAEAYESVCTDPSQESIVYLTGPEDGSQRIVSRVIEVGAAWQDAAGIHADPDLHYETLQELSEQGYNLHAICHNHPGRGRSACDPSPTDRETQDRLEALQYETIGLIMTSDGFVRAFANDLDFELEVYGDNVRRLNNRKFELSV